MYMKESPLLRLDSAPNGKWASAGRHLCQLWISREPAQSFSCKVRAKRLPLPALARPACGWCLGLCERLYCSCRDWPQVERDADLCVGSHGGAGKCRKSREEESASVQLLKPSLAAVEAVLAVKLEILGLLVCVLRLGVVLCYPKWQSKQRFQEPGRLTAFHLRVRS